MFLTSQNTAQYRFLAQVRPSSGSHDHPSPLSCYGCRWGKNSRGDAGRRTGFGQERSPRRRGRVVRADAAQVATRARIFYWLPSFARIRATACLVLPEREGASRRGADSGGERKRGWDWRSWCASLPAGGRPSVSSARHAAAAPELFDDARLDQIQWQIAISIVRSNGDLSSEERIVVGDPHKQIASCNCEQFTRTGVLCAHALKVLDLMNIKLLPDHYIPKRWTREARYGTIQDNTRRSIIENPKLDAMLNYKYMSHKFKAA